jgi:hypothetical protein
LFGAPIANAAGAFPTFSRLNVMLGAGTPTAAVGNEIVVGDPPEKSSVPPVGVTDRGIATLLFVGSFVKRLSDPVSAVPAVADDGMVAVTTNAPDPPSPIERAPGETEKTSPDVAAVTARGTGPEPVIEKTWVTGGAAHTTLPKTIGDEENIALTTPEIDGLPS